MDDKKKTISPHWYLLYTKPRAEKKVDAELQLRGYTTYLPLHKTLRQWSDRKKWVEEPLFKSYLFIHTELERNYYDIVNVFGVVKFVNFERKPAVVDPRELDFIRRLLGEDATGMEFSIWEQEQELPEGTPVVVKGGPLMGTEGTFIERRGQQQVLVELKTIHQAILVTIPAKLVEVMK